MIVNLSKRWILVKNPQNPVDVDYGRSLMAVLTNVAGALRFNFAALKNYSITLSITIILFNRPYIFQWYIERTLGVIHKPCGHIFENFWPTSPFVNNLLNKAYAVKLTFGKPPPLCHVHMVCECPLILQLPLHSGLINV